MSSLQPIVALRTSGRTRIVVACALVICLLGGFAFVLKIFGGVKGTEFSPQCFLQRGFSYYRIPIVNIQITPIVREDQTNGLERYLFVNKLIPKDPNPQRWDLVQFDASGESLWHGDAKLLCTYLDMEREFGQLDWLAWTKENVAAAQILWPVIAEVARQQLYFLVPDIMEGMQNKFETLELEEKLNDHLITEYTKIAATYQQLNRHKEAIRMYGLVLAKDNQHQSALLGRAQSYEKIGQLTAAAADRDLAQQQKHAPIKGDEPQQPLAEEPLNLQETIPSVNKKGISVETDDFTDDIDFSFGS